MTKSELFANLSEIAFTERLPEEIERDIIASFESATGRSLARGEPIRLILETITLALILLRNELDKSGKLNLLAYSYGSFLDHLGAFFPVFRFRAGHASTKARFFISSSTPTSLISIPKGTRITPDGDLLFATVEDLTIAAGETYGDVTVECLTPGEIGNGFLPGQINKLVDVFPYELSVSNLDTTAGGSDVERIHIAPESFSVAGPTGAYKYWALSAHSSVVDVAVLGPADDDRVPLGNVFIYPLLKGGELPNDEICETVAEVCSADEKRPDTDFVHVLPPEAVTFNLEGYFWIDRALSSQANRIKSAVLDAIDEWIIWQKSKLGRDLNPSELVHRIIQAGAKRVEINSPAFQVIQPYQVAMCVSNDFTYEGLEDA